jgi:hypothetical protein
MSQTKMIRNKMSTIGIDFYDELEYVPSFQKTLKSSVKEDTQKSQSKKTRFVDKRQYLDNSF